MRIRLTCLTLLLPWVLAAPALGGITVTSYSTSALTNGFAPSLQGPYFAQQTLENVSPALANVSGDWIGPNADGTPATWHYLGSSQSSGTTTFDANGYSVTAAGSFTYTLDTTVDFIDPRPSVFTPGGAVSYNGHFTLDQTASYSITGTLNQWGRVRLNPIGGGPVVFDQTNATPTPMVINFSGTIPPGQYRVLIGAGLSVPPFPNGVNHYAASGSYSSVLFTAQVPEPSNAVMLICFIGATLRRHTPGNTTGSGLPTSRPR